MSISRFTSALMAGSQENTVALAAVNFDFSLYKVTAPTEYQALGTLLSHKRRENGEIGSHHATARKLGALFRSKLPSVPWLIKAYGERVSYIAEKVKTTGGSKNAAMETIFSKNLGFDGTTIWAAATSGLEAICIQLLGCLLAKFWSAPEAISIWAEIIEERKKELSQQDNAFDFPEVVAAQATVTRENLAEWDASTRAWLRIADEQMNLKQTQLRLIVDNLDVAVNYSSNTYESVMQAWINSMKLVNDLVGGASQGIHDGAVLIGLSSWHLYPDMIVYRERCTEISQHDELFPAGTMLTIGLQPSPKAGTGIHWSLPLAKLKYYGDPVFVTKLFNDRSSRVSFEQLLLVVIGCLAQQWPKTDRLFEHVCKYYTLLCDRSGEPLLPNYGPKSWIRWMHDVATKYLASQGQSREEQNRLLKFGYRRCSEFLNTTKGPITLDDQMFQLSDPEKFFRAHRHIESQVQYLRGLVSHLKGNDAAGQWIIFCSSEQRYSLTTAIETSSDEFKDDSPVTKHYIWGSNTFANEEQISTGPPAVEESLNGWTCYSSNFCIPGSAGRGDTLFMMRIGQPDTSSKIWSLYKPQKFDLKGSMLGGEERHQAEVEGAWMINFTLVFGTTHGVALYRKTPCHIKSVKRQICPKRIEAAKIFNTFEKGMISLGDIEVPESLRVLEGLAAVGNIYSSMESASISMDVTLSRLTDTEWFKSFLNLPPTTTGSDGHPVELDLPTAFSSVIFMETGYQDLQSDLLKSVMAISIDNSIFTASGLVSDPYPLASPGLIMMALGNVGKPGLNLLIPPKTPVIRKPKTDEWNVINHEIWNGHWQDSFSSTSLHLQLTEYRVPYASHHEGSRDAEAYFQESVISIYDKSVWVGDVNIMESLKRINRSGASSFIRLPGPLSDQHLSQEMTALRRSKFKKNAKCNKSKSLSNGTEIRCIDNWYELIDKPSGPTVIRSSGNWVGRLATLSICLQLGYDAVVLHNENCKNGCFSNISFIQEYVVKDDPDIILVV